MSEHPTSSGQTAEHGIDTAVILAMTWTPASSVPKWLLVQLCDALDRQREETARLRYVAEKSLNDYHRAMNRVDDARARLDEIRALCDDERPGYTAATLNAEIRAILDREDRA